MAQFRSSPPTRRSPLWRRSCCKAGETPSSCTTATTGWLAWLPSATCCAYWRVRTSRREATTVGIRAWRCSAWFRSCPRRFSRRTLGLVADLATSSDEEHESAAKLSPEPTDEELRDLIRYWNAANYLTVAQIYLGANPLLREPLTAEQIKPRLLGHWGTSPGLNLVYVHLNRLIRQTGQDVLYVAGPGHGGPALVANTYLEGGYSEIYPQVSAEEAGLLRLVRQFSAPGGIPSHVSVPTPGSIHEGGELGYALVHAYGAAMDSPDLLVACVVGDGEAETGPLEGSWKGNRFLNPARDGAVLPILHLNQYKIANPTVLGRSSRAEVETFLRAHGHEPIWVEGSDVAEVHRAFAAALSDAHRSIRRIQEEARAPGARVEDRPH